MQQCNKCSLMEVKLVLKKEYETAHQIVMQYDRGMPSDLSFCTECLLVLICL